MKKLTALFLALIMVVSVLPAGIVFAAEAPAITEEGITANHGPDVVLDGETIMHFKEAKGQGTWNGTDSAKNYDGKMHRWQILLKMDLCLSFPISVRVITKFSIM